MAVRPLKGMPQNELQMELQRGARFVYFTYVFSVLVMSFKRGSVVYVVPPGESAIAAGLKYSGLSLLVGWWGLPWGIIWTIMALVKNFQGGTDVTDQILARLRAASAAPPAAAAAIAPK
jgi:hypothetical protein